MNTQEMDTRLGQVDPDPDREPVHIVESPRPPEVRKQRALIISASQRRLLRKIGSKKAGVAYRGKEDPRTIRSLTLKGLIKDNPMGTGRVLTQLGQRIVDRMKPKAKKHHARGYGPEVKPRPPAKKKPGDLITRTGAWSAYVPNDAPDDSPSLHELQTAVKLINRMASFDAITLRVEGNRLSVELA